MMYIYSATPSFANLSNDVLGISRSDVAPIFAVTSRSSLALLSIATDKMCAPFAYSLFYVMFSHIFIPKNVEISEIFLLKENDWSS